MKRVSVKLADLQPNPYKKFIRGGQIDKAVVAQIVESAERTSLWEQWVVRETDSGYQLAFGHNRLEAAKKVLGEDAKVSVQVEDYTDGQMFCAMADENAGDEESVAAQVDVVATARKMLREHNDWCKDLQLVSLRETATRSPKGGRLPGEQHEHGSVNCIEAFLGERNWSRSKVGKLLKLAENADRSILAKAITVDHNNEREPGDISQTVALHLADLPRTVQRAAAETIRSVDVNIPPSVIKDVVIEVQHLAPARQEAGVKRAIKRKAETEKIKEIERERKKETKTKPKSKKELPDIGIILENLATQVIGITDYIEKFRSVKEDVVGHASFKHFEKKVALLNRAIAEIHSREQVKLRA